MYIYTYILLFETKRNVRHHIITYLKILFENWTSRLAKFKSLLK